MFILFILRGVNKLITKEQLEKIFGIEFLDYEVEMFNFLIKTYEEGTKVIYMPARKRRSKVVDCFNICSAIKTKKIKNDEKILYDEWLGERYEKNTR